jgi:hypothetical protein
MRDPPVSGVADGRFAAGHGDGGDVVQNNLVVLAEFQGVIHLQLR